jgi:DNA polymerase-1
VGGATNFREDLHPQYKDVPSRNKGRKARPAWYGAAKDYVQSHPQATVSEGVEADDLLAMWQEGEDVIVSVDKDLRQVPGLHFDPRCANLGQRDTWDLTPAEAFRNLRAQLLSGDSTDNIPGIPGVGPVKAQKALAEGVEPIEAYKHYYGDDWEEQFVWNGRLLFLLRGSEDQFSVERYWELAELA